MHHISPTSPSKFSDFEEANGFKMWWRHVCLFFHDLPGSPNPKQAFVGFCCSRFQLSNEKQILGNGCFNWMIPNLYIGNGFVSPNIHFSNGCLGFQVDES